MNSRDNQSMDLKYTEPQLIAIAAMAAEMALARRPAPSSVTLKGAAEIMGVSVRTVARMNLPRNQSNRIPYSAVVDAMAARR